MHRSPAKVVPIGHRSLGWQIQEMDAVLELTEVMIKEIQSRQWERVAAIQAERDGRLRVCLENLENIENSSEAREKFGRYFSKIKPSSMRSTWQKSN